MYKILAEDQKTYGPVTVEEVRRWIAQRRVHAHTLACTESAAAWQPLSRFPEFAGDLAAGPSPYSTTAGFPIEQRTNSMATSGLILSCIALVCCGGCAPFAVLGVVFSIVGLTQANRDPAEIGKGVAIAGLVIGIISLLGTIAGTFATIVLGAAGAILEALQQ